jgi:hypothetical protein|tara:strand:- start:26 stop:226 length:201 start_codon:yes stop_codon:yes gene_type:complete
VQITKEYLLSEIGNMEKQRNHAHDVAVASQAAIDVMQAMIKRLDLPEEAGVTFSDLGLPDPVPMEK